MYTIEEFDKEKTKVLKYIENNGNLDMLNEKEKIAANYRLKYPEASLLELAEIISMETNERQEDWESLGLSNDFLFGKVMSNPKLCIKLLERKR